MKKSRLQPFPLAPMGEKDLSGADGQALHAHSLIVTRYFLRAAAPAGTPARTDAEIRDWFVRRERVFEQYTLPSIENQTVQRKTWLIYIEKGYRELLPQALLSGPASLFTEIVEVDSSQPGFGNFTNDVRQRIDDKLLALGATHAEPVVTVTRIDNDDALSIDYLETLVRLATSEVTAKLKSAIVTFPHGVQHADGGAIGTYVFNNNHFLSSIHRTPTLAARIHHAISFNHGHVFSRNKGVLVMNSDLPMWMEVVHGDNISNRFRSVMLLQMTPALQARFGAPTGALGGSAAVAESGGATILDKMRAAQDHAHAMKPHAFLKAYAEILSHARVGSMLDIGIHEGGSLRFWRKVFGPELRLCGIDIKEECSRFAPEPANHVLIGSQVDAAVLERAGAIGAPFDLIVDDGSHQNAHMLETFALLFRFVKPGGIYVVEDMFTSYWVRYGGGLRKENSFVERTKARIDDIFAPFLGPKYAKHHLLRPQDAPAVDSVSAQIDSISFYRCGLTVFRKADPSQQGDE